jgi:hypothetical protein
MKIYLCSRYSRRDEMRGVRREIHKQGHHTIVSRWLDTDWECKTSDRTSSAAPSEYREKYAKIDTEDVLACDCLVAFTEKPDAGGRGGRHVEFGIAIALEKRQIVVGYRENLFYYLPQVEICSNTDDLLKVLYRLKE